VLAHTAEGPEKGPGFGWGRECAGNSRVEEALQRYAYKRVPERIGARVTPRAVKGAVRRLDPVRRRKVPGRWGCNATSIKRKLAGDSARRKASWVVPPSSLGRTDSAAPPFGGGRWNDPGLAGESGTPRTRRGAWGGSCRSAWNRRGGACGRQWTSEDGTISVKAPPAVAIRRRSAGGQHSGRRKAPPRRKLGRGSGWGNSQPGRGCIGIGSTEAGVSE